MKKILFAFLLVSVWVSCLAQTEIKRDKVTANQQLEVKTGGTFIFNGTTLDGVSTDGTLSTPEAGKLPTELAVATALNSAKADLMDSLQAVNDALKDSINVLRALAEGIDGADNLGDHVATIDLDMDGNNVVNLAPEAYDATGWDGDNSAAPKNDVRDKIESLNFPTIFTSDGNIPSLRKIDLTPTNGQGLKIFDTGDESAYYLWLDPQFGLRTNQTLWVNDEIYGNGADFTWSGALDATFSIGGTDEFTITDNRAAKIGLTYFADYNSTILLNPRSVPDVGGVGTLITNALGAYGLADAIAADNALASNETMDYTGTTFGIRDDDAFYRMLFSNAGEVVQILTKDGDGHFLANLDGLEMGHDNVAYFNIDDTDGSATFTDERVTKIGLELKGFGEDGAGVGGVYGDLKPNALVPRAYTDGAFLKLASDETQILNSDVSFSLIDSVGVPITDANVGSSSTGSTRRTVVQSADSLFAVLAGGDFCYLQNALYAPDGYYAIQKKLNRSAWPMLHSKNVWFDVNYTNQSFDSDVTVRCWSNEYKTFEYLDIGADNIDDSFVGHDRYVILTVNTNSAQVQEADSIYITASNNANLPVGTYAIWGSTSNTVIIEHSISTMSSTAWVGTALLKVWTTDNIYKNFQTEDTLDVTGDLISHGEVYLKNRHGIEPGADFAIGMDEATGKLMPIDINPDSLLYATVSRMLDSLNDIRADMGGGGGGGGGDTRITNRATDLELFEDFYNASSVAGFEGAYQFENTQSGTVTTTHNHATYGAGGIGTVNMGGDPSNAYNNRLLGVKNIAANDTDWEFEVRIRWDYAPSGSQHLLIAGLTNNSYSSGVPSSGVYFSQTANSVYNTKNSGTLTNGVFSGGALASATWHVIRITYDQGTNTANFYANGVLQGTSTTNIPTSTALMIDIGSHDGNGFETDAAPGVTVDYVYFKKAR